MRTLCGDLSSARTNALHTHELIRRVDHTAIVVANMDEAIDRWQGLTGAEVESRAEVPEQRVEIAMLSIGDTHLELIRPLDSESGVASFLAGHGESLHHVGLEVDDIEAEMRALEGTGVRFTDSVPRTGAHGTIAFLHPKSTGGVLLELIQKETP